MQMTKVHVAAAGETHRGGRTINQDTLLIEPALGLYAVFDGMGGHAAGEVAAQIGRDSLVEFARRNAYKDSPRELLEFGIDWTAAKIYRSAKAKPEYAGMGSTVVSCLVVPESNEIIVGHVGDSRAYLLRDGRFAQLTRDHNIAQQLIDAGDTPKEDEMRYLGAILTRRLGDEHGAKADMLEMELRAGDRLLLCSDGLSNCVSAEAIQRVLGSSEGPQELARALINMALSTGTATDNVTALVLICSEGEMAQRAA